MFPSGEETSLTLKKATLPTRSWFSKNYEKAILGGSAAVALGLAYLGWSTFGGVDEAFRSTLKGPGANHKTAVPDADSIPKALQSLTFDRGESSNSHR